MNEIKACKTGQCHNYAISIASQYFETIDDHINLLLVTKRFRCNLERYFAIPFH